jgi:hypothetical protein
MIGWVIVYVPGGNIYQMIDGQTTKKKTTLAKKIAKHSLKTILAAAQIYWWIKS